MQQLGSKGGRVRKGECAECIIGKLGLGSVQLLEPRKNIERPFGPRPISIPVAALRRLFPALSEVSCKTRLHIDHEWFRSVSRAVARIGEPRKRDVRLTEGTSSPVHLPLCISVCPPFAVVVSHLQLNGQAIRVIRIVVKGLTWYKVELSCL